MPEDTPKQVRGRKQSTVTRYLGTLDRYITEECASGVSEYLGKLSEAYSDLEVAHYLYHDSLEKQEDIEASEKWFASSMDKYRDSVKEARAWLKSTKSSSSESASSSTNDSSMIKPDILTLLNAPKVEVETFTGNPIEFKTFMSIFNESVGNTSLSDQSKLTRLIQCTSGNAKAAIKNCALNGDQDGYTEALAILGKRFGEPNLVARSLIESLFTGKSVMPKDLALFADNITTAYNTLKHMKMLSEIDTQGSILSILQRCPNFVKSAWRKRALSIKESSGNYPDFETFSKFMSCKAADINDPVYGNESYYPKTSQRQSGSNNSRSSMQTDVAPPSKFTGRGKFTCVKCKMTGHKLYQCKSFKDMSASERLTFVRDNNLCFNCFGTNHRSSDCRLKTMCNIQDCKFKHSKFLHIDRADDAGNGAAAAENSFDDHTNTKRVINSAFSNGRDTMVYVPMVQVIINEYTKVWALLDTGSTNTFISHALASKLGLKGKPIKYHISTLGNTSEQASQLVNLKVTSLDHNSYYLRDVMVVKYIPAKQPPIKFRIEDYPQFSDIALPRYEEGINVDILIGMDNAHLMAPMDVRPSKVQGGPHAILTVLGWAVGGPIQGTFTSIGSNMMSHCVAIDSQIQKIWDVETSDESQCSLSQNDKYVLSLWENNINFLEGHYYLPIPFKDIVPSFPNNRFVAEKRLNYLYPKLESMGLTEKYSQNIQKFIKEGYAEQVPPDELNLNDGTVWYLPHHPVLNDKKPGKVRTVFDCAAKFTDKSLNNQCLQGPDLNNKLMDVLLKFRQYEYAVIADVECMYMQVKIPVKDRNVLRLLWNINGQVTDLRMTSHLFGGVWCAASSTFALRRSTSDFECSEKTRYAIHNCMYVDDLLKSCTTPVEAIDIALGCKSVLKSAGFNLTKFVSNHKQILDHIPQVDLAPGAKVITPDTNGRALGIKWNISQDVFFYVHDSVLDNPAETKRKMLSQLSMLYDPLGLVGPVIHRGKILFQDANRMKLNWDSSMPLSLIRDWKNWLKSLKNLSQVIYPRCICPPDFVDAAVELHHFSDASQVGYGAVTYIRFINAKGVIHVALLTSKSRLAPLKQITIPRLELCAAVLAVNLDFKVKRILEFNFLPSTFWTDSKIVLAYIASETKRYKIFVGNRVAAIRENSDPKQWKHIKSADNIADVLSRGCTVDTIPKSWIKGPKFLASHKSNWQKSVPEKEELLESDCEIKNVTVKCAEVNACPIEEHPIDKLVNHYSSFYRLKKALARMVRIANYFRRDKKEPNCKINAPVTGSEMQNAEKILVKHTQSSCYKAEIQSLINSGEVKSNSSLRKLNPLINHDGLLVVGGRLKHANLPMRVKHPYLLPASHKLSKMLVLDRHNETHLGVEWLITDLRSTFWITKVRPLIKAIKHNCNVCKKLYAPTYHQKMGDLLGLQSEPSRPAFSHTGLDIFGPFYIKQGRAQVKRYGCIYTCLTTRAIHLEILQSLESDSFINGFSRFIARRGCPEKVFSDNGTNIVGARNDLLKSLRDLDRRKVIEAAAVKNIDWSFNPPSASHMGGLWERMIRTVRRILCAILGRNTRLTDDILHTIICNVENIVNGRPITKVNTDINDDEPLTPNHLLLQHCNISVSWGIFFSADLYRKRWRSSQYLTDLFWKRWSKEYVSLLQLRSKWQTNKTNLKIGDLVLIQTENTPRGMWPLGLIKEVKIGRDNLVRSVRIKTKDTELVRPMTKLVPLEGDCLWEII